MASRSGKIIPNTSFRPCLVPTNYRTLIVLYRPIGDGSYYSQTDKKSRQDFINTDTKICWADTIFILSDTSLSYILSDNKKSRQDFINRP